MIVVSDLTGKEYDDSECVFFRNPTQSAYYISRNIIPVDLFTDSSLRLVFVFTKEDHNRIKDEWRERGERIKRGEEV